MNWKGIDNLILFSKIIHVSKIQVNSDEISICMNKYHYNYKYNNRKKTPMKIMICELS